MIRRPPRSTLFPLHDALPILEQYSDRHRNEGQRRAVRVHAVVSGFDERFEAAAERNLDSAQQQLRSEEHTSELQSPCNLVCRLLLEKKKILSTRLYDLSISRE